VRRKNRFPPHALAITFASVMHDHPPDLLALISEARGLVPDDRHIWCSASDTFDSRVVQRRGFLLGGALSPHFLRDTSETWTEVPWTMRLHHCRVVVCDRAAHEPLATWLPLMEGVAQSGESLLVVTETIGAELLRTFIVNALKSTLRVCVVHPPRDRHGNPATGLTSLARACATPPSRHDQLPRLAEVWIRRTATALFPSAEEAALAAAGLQNFAVIETGGKNHEDQYDRLRFLMQELQQSGGG
jgi:hypothetical protein